MLLLLIVFQKYAQTVEKKRYICYCKFNDKQCSNGYVWYIDKFGSIKRNDPHEDE